MTPEEKKQNESTEIYRGMVEKELPQDRPPEKEQKEIKGWRRWVLIAMAIFCGIWIILPEPTDAFFLVGWLDEGTAALILMAILSRLGIRVPLLDRFIKKKVK